MQEYVDSVKEAVDDLTTTLFNFDVKTNNPNPFCTRPKVHCLHHLHEDIRRFGCALHFESEKGEMYNKFIREQLFHTNRIKPSFDVAIRFAKQESLKHITDGGSWINKQHQRVKYGSDETQFRQQFFGAREFAENSYTAVTGSPKSGFKGVFMMTESADDDGEKYAFIQ